MFKTICQKPAGKITYRKKRKPKKVLVNQFLEKKKENEKELVEKTHDVSILFFSEYFLLFIRIFFFLNLCL